MLPLLLAFATFAAWWALGLATLSVAGSDLTDLRICLTAPIIGTTVTVLPLFLASEAGVPISTAAPPLLAALLATALVVLARRRPRLPLVTVLAISALGLVDLVLVGRPAFDFGFAWIANANDDMANYVLSATDLLHHGLLGSVNASAIAHGRDYASLLRAIRGQGGRPGADITLAAFSTILGRPPYELFMPLILAFNLTTIAATGALAMQATQRARAALIAGALLVASPLAAFGVLQQLMPQVWGSGIAAALFALLMRPELHRAPRASVRALIPIVGLVIAMVIVYVEMAAILLVTYVIYVVVLTLQRQISRESVVRLWGAAIVGLILILNTYGVREYQWLAGQTAGGVKSGHASAPLFGFTLIPAALPAVLGLQQLPASPHARLLAPSIVVAAVMLLALGMAAIASARRGVAAAVSLVAYLLLGLFLGIHQSDFGLYKLYMYIQPLVAAAAGVWFSRLERRRWIVVASASLLALVSVQVATGAQYVKRSRNPVDLPNASDRSLLPAFRQQLASTRLPTIAATDNPTLGKLEGVANPNGSLLLISRYLFPNFLSSRLGGWSSEAFKLLSDNGPKTDYFLHDDAAGGKLARNHCSLALPSGSQVPFNRRLFPEGSPNLLVRPCREYSNVLVFTASELGQGFYLPKSRPSVSVYQLEPDYFYPGRTFSGLGRYALFQVVNPTNRVRLVIDVTDALQGNGFNRLPTSAAVVGDRRVSLPFVGRGSARVVSPPLKPQMIGGLPYVLLDMGRSGQLFEPRRHGLQALWGSNVHVDPRYLTAYVRDISLISSTDYAHFRPPKALSDFPGDLQNPDLVYSGIYDDGWLGSDSFVTLAGGKATDLVVRASLIPVQNHQHLTVLDNGRTVLSQTLEPGTVQLGVPIPASAGARRVELRWSSESSLYRGERRRVTARLQFIGLGDSGWLKPITQYPAELRQPGANYSGIYTDRWTMQTAYLALPAGGPAAAELDVRVPNIQGQHLDALVDGRRVLSTSAVPGTSRFDVPLPPSRSPRTLSLQWSKVTQLPAPDSRIVAAQVVHVRLQPMSMGVAAGAPTSVAMPGALRKPGLQFAGIYSDGWVAADSFVVLKGGTRAELTVRAQLPAIAGQRLDVFINGTLIASRPVVGGTLVWRISVPPSRGDRRVELRFAKAIRLQPPDTRTASALLRSLKLSRKP